MKTTDHEIANEMIATLTTKYGLAPRFEDEEIRCFVPDVATGEHARGEMKQHAERMRRNARGTDAERAALLVLDAVMHSYTTARPDRAGNHFVVISLY